MPRHNLISLRSGTENQWTSTNPILSSGEPGFEIDTGRVKIGNGTTAWSGLYYNSIIPTGLIAGNNININLGTNGSTATIGVSGSVQQSESLVTSVFNETGATLSKMTAVYINGGHGDLPTIQKAIATSDITSAGTYGLVYQDIDNMEIGQVVVFGLMGGVNTDPAHGGIAGATEGSVLYLSPTVSGAITTTKPYAPDHIVSIGTVVRVHQNEGVIEVRVQNGFELEELHNVAVTGATNGQFLQYNSGSGLWVPSSSGNFTSLSVNNTGVVVGSGGSAGYLSKFTNSNTIENSSIYQEFSNKIRIGENQQGYIVVSDDSYGGELGILTNLDEVIAIKFQDGSFRYGGGYVGGENIVVASNGNVGIGTDTPTEKLTVNGNGNFIGNLTVSGNLSPGSISGVDPLYIQTQTASMILNDYTIFLQNDAKSQGNFYLEGPSIVQDALLVTDSDRIVTSLSSPSLTEIGYVGGVTSNIQTQLDSKQNTLINPITGTGVANHIPYWSSTSGLLADSNQLVWDSTNNRLGIGTASPTSTLQVSGLITANSGTFESINVTGPAVSSGSLVSFTHPDNTGSSDYDAIISGQLHLTRNANNGIYNLATEASWDQSLSPSGTIWNNEGWSNLENFKSRTYSALWSAVGGQLGYNLPGAELIMKHVDTNRYWKVKFTSWTQGGGGGFAYERQEIFIDNAMNVSGSSNFNDLLTANKLSASELTCEKLSVIGEDLTVGGQTPSISLKGYSWFGKVDGSVGIAVSVNNSGTFGSSSAFATFGGFNESVTAYTPMCFASNFSPQLYLNTNGNVGINKATPSQKLDVNGNINISENLIFNNNTSLSESELTTIINSKNIYMWSNYI
jgi:hypothetical protein